jgi:hypothetical protein
MAGTQRLLDVPPGDGRRPSLTDDAREKRPHLDAALAGVDVELEPVAWDAQVVDGKVRRLLDLQELSEVESLSAGAG